MKIRLSHDEVTQACAEFAAKNTDYKTSVEGITDTQYFVITDQLGTVLEYESVEFEYEA